MVYFLLFLIAVMWYLTVVFNTLHWAYTACTFERSGLFCVAWKNWLVKQKQYV